MLLIGLNLFKKKHSKVFQKYCLHLTGKISSEQLSKVEEVEPFGHSGAPKNETMPYFDHFPRLGKIDPYAKCISVLWMMKYEDDIDDVLVG